MKKILFVATVLIIAGLLNWGIAEYVLHFGALTYIATIVPISGLYGWFVYSQLDL